ncbi:MAG: alpha/beta hydrolase [Flavobacteriaceae bacterium]|nr:alpha/beta hydrolase [Flavobacteriaceae bacterium]
MVEYQDDNLKMNIKNILIYFSILSLMLACKVDKEQTIDPVASLFSKTTVAAEKEYRFIDSISLKLDVFVPSKRLGESPWMAYTDGNKPTLLYFHGGGWKDGEKESRILEILPYVDKGWVVVTANYRLLKDASLPEIIGDCRTALEWVYEHANQFKMDTTKIFISGNSAGGHLALMSGLLKDDSFYGSDFSSKHKNNIAGIINWYGITDVPLFVKNWKNKQILTKDDMSLDTIYNYTSPINFIDGTIPPILTIHGSIDSVVSFKHAEILHQKLDENNMKNKLLKIDGKKHGNFNAEEMTYIYKEIWKFTDEVLAKQE